MNEIDRINKMLPQTQCQRCGYSSCKPYAEAILFNNEDINRCPPGGNELIEKLLDDNIHNRYYIKDIILS